MNAEISAYLENLAPDRREMVQTLRQLILETLPQAEENFSYRMPTYSVSGKPIAAVASQKHYLSIYLDVEALDAHREEFAHLNCGKSCIRFRKISDLPLQTVRTILQETLALNESRV